MHAVTVEFDLVQPFRSFRRRVDEFGQLRPHPLRQSDGRLRRCRSRHIGLSNLFDRQIPGGKRAKQLGFRPGEIEPGPPVQAMENDHLPIVNRRDIGTGLGCQEGEGLPCPIRHRAPQSGKTKPVPASLGEFPLRFRRFRAGELEEVRGRDQATSFREAPTLGAEIDDRRSFWLRRRETPTQLHQFDALFAAAKHGCGLGRPNIVARLQIGLVVTLVPKVPI
jgi:hypothetical protein